MGLTAAAPSSHRRRRPLCSLAPLVLVSTALLFGHQAPVTHAQSPSMSGATTMAATTQLSSKGSQAGCDHYRNGYLGLAMCVNFYDDTANGTFKGQGWWCWGG
jgi:hypothetical protein